MAIASLDEHRRRTHEQALQVAIDSLYIAKITNRPVSEVRGWAETVITQCDKLMEEDDESGNE